MAVTFVPTVPYATEFPDGTFRITGVLEFAGHTAAQDLDLTRYIAQIKHVSIDCNGGFIYWYDIANKQIHVYDGIGAEENDGAFAKEPTIEVIGRQS